MDSHSVLAFSEIHHPVDSHTSPRCLVCSGDILDDAVECVDCSTAHHSDCFAYNEKCAVFGCGSECCRPRPLLDVVLSAPLIVARSEAPILGRSVALMLVALVTLLCSL
jgi:hypothetical protein